MSRIFPQPSPSLPSFTSLLIQGRYHPSAPIHLCLSIPSGTKAMLLTPSRQTLIQGLVEYNDEWINSRSGIGSVTRISSQVDILYPPTPGHLVALLSSFRTHETSTSAPIDAKTTLESAPSLIVLHEPSAYFLSESSDNLCVTLSNKPELRSSAAPASFVLFDSQLDRLKLPVLRPPPRSAFDDPEERSEAPRPESVTALAQKYFEWVGNFEIPEGDSPSSPGVASRVLKLRLHKQDSHGDDQDIVWGYSELLQSGKSLSQKPSKTFVW
ncbi:hypothetical protein BV22DRAFT_1101856 [Leucogyrophana mollusca]|uniref:Uncharacterized protein n=1 Tax=Leucogyrophana mollusca TaxID=85980 RepID=A0ACB8BXN8_9AGAM|nr:hypothetical protein BV22DRAFT_1101856 [Leucogyrophana mollusca]